CVSTAGGCDPPAPVPRRAMIWATPGHGVVLEPFVAVFAPVAPAVDCTTVLFSSVMPPVVLPTCTSTISVIPVGGVQETLPEAIAWAATSSVFATVVVTSGVAWVVELAVA